MADRKLVFVAFFLVAVLMAAVVLPATAQDFGKCLKDCIDSCYDGTNAAECSDMCSQACMIKPKNK
ncbi:hypothetical protein KSP40_PGU019188 [Platanthera guangdongensis]|uniref:Uncharacterized protein n=1 Tax=Platanthera guangdongensis TaxID=2320717 RepID=A0ABR2MDF2_9ASPA